MGESRRFVMLLTNNTCDSFWMMQELVAAIELGLEVILVPMEGHRWPDPDHEDKKILCSPPTSLVLEGVEKHVEDEGITRCSPDSVREAIAALFDAGLDGETNLSHSFSYAQAFMRLFMRRCGVSSGIREDLAKVGLADSSEAVELFMMIRELNLMKFSFFEVANSKFEKGGKPMAYAELVESGALEVIERTDAGDLLSSYTPNEFYFRVKTRRVSTMLLPAKQEQGGRKKLGAFKGAFEGGARGVAKLDLHNRSIEDYNVTLTALLQKQSAEAGDVGDDIAGAGAGEAAGMDESGMEASNRARDVLEDQQEGMEDVVGEGGDEEEVPEDEGLLDDLEAEAEDGAEEAGEALEEALDSLMGDLAELLGDVLGALKKCLKPLLAFIQINSSFKASFPSMKLPADVDAIHAFFGTFNFNFINMDGFNESTAGLINFANTTMVKMGVFFFLIFGLVFGYVLNCLLFARGATNRGRREAYMDGLVGTMVTLMFLAYPALCQDLLKLYRPRYFGDPPNQVIVLAEDWSLGYGDAYILPFQLGGIAFLIMYMIGIPAFFFVALWTTARPKELKPLEPKQAAERDRLQARRETRYAMLYDIYDEEAWWWELVEVGRKLIMTSALGFINPPGSTTQVAISAFISIAFFLLATKYSPFKDNNLDRLSFVSQLSTTATLLLVLAGRADVVAEKGLLSQEVLDTLLTIFQVLPLLASAGVALTVGKMKVGKILSRRRKARETPYIRLDKVPSGESKKTGILHMLSRALSSKKKVVEVKSSTRDKAEEKGDGVEHAEAV
jgi:hypothetical protein